MRIGMLGLATLLLFLVGVSSAADKEEPGPVELGDSRASRWQAGVLITAKGDCVGIFSTVPVPTPWPEQEVKVVVEEITPGVRVRYEMINNGVKQMQVSIPTLRAGQSAQAVLTFEITRRAILAPKETDQYRIPKRVSRDISKYLGPSPYIESRDRKIRELARELTEDKEGDWAKVEAIYDWVREHVEYREGKLKGALAALRDQHGDCEELTSLFIALCRASKVPARTVWVPDHCYPEFYLEDDEGQGFWFPCQAAGDRSFGTMMEMRPILQKGDNFKVPGKRTAQRYVAELLKAKSVRGASPEVRFVRKQLE